MMSLSTILIVVYSGTVSYSILWEQAFAHSVLISNDELGGQGNVAKPNQALVFTCVTRGSGILEWRSAEYIGIGNVLQLLSVNCVGRNFSSGNNLALGTCINVTYDRGIEVIESELYVIASLLHPVSSVTCTNNGIGTSEEIIFNTTEPTDIVLTSSLKEDMVAVALQPITFTCTTRNTGILEWRSQEYIGDGNILQLLSINCVGNNATSGKKLAVATCKEITYDHGVEVIESELYLEALVQFPISTVTCTNNGRGSSASIQFQTIIEQPNSPQTTRKPETESTTRKLGETTTVHTHPSDSVANKNNIFIVISGTVVVVIMMTLIVITGVIVFWRQHSVPVLNLKFKSKDHNVQNNGIKEKNRSAYSSTSTTASLDIIQTDGIA